MTTDSGALRTETMTFGDLTIAFDARVLRPRPWTADQSRWAAELLATAPEGPVLELCAGAGQIGLLAIALAPRSLVCVDLNPAACAFTRENAAREGLADLVEVREGRLEESVRPDERFALVIADPPWVRRAETGSYPEDPLLAIDGGDDGLDVARACLATAGTHLLPGGSVVLQLGALAQVDRLHTGIAAAVGLAVTDVRSGERGVLVRLEPALDESGSGA